MERKFAIDLWYFAGVILLLLAFQWWSAARQVETLAYSEFQSYLREGKIAEVAVGDDSLRAVLKEPLPDGRRLIYAVRVEPQFAQELDQFGVRVTGVIESNLIASIVSWVLPGILLFAIWYFLIRNLARNQGPGGFMMIGKSKARVAVEKDIKVTFDNVAGSMKPRKS